jgi:hypothetical protein
MDRHVARMSRTCPYGCPELARHALEVDEEDEEDGEDCDKDIVLT